MKKHKNDNDEDFWFTLSIILFICFVLAIKYWLRLAEIAIR